MLITDRFGSESSADSTSCVQAKRNEIDWVARKSRTILLGALAVILTTCQLPAQVANTARHSAPAPSVVGFWAGEDAALPQGGRKPTGPTTYYDPAYRGDFTPELWRVLQDYRVPLYLNVRYGRDFGPVSPTVHSYVVALVRKANSLKIPVIAWVVVPYAQGYWAY